MKVNWDSTHAESADTITESLPNRFPCLRFSFLFFFVLVRTKGVRTESTLNLLRSLVPISISMMNLFVDDKQYQFALHRIWPHTLKSLSLNLNWFRFNWRRFHLSGVFVADLSLYAIEIIDHCRNTELYAFAHCNFIRISNENDDTRFFQSFHLVNPITFVRQLLENRVSFFSRIYSHRDRSHWIERFSIEILRNLPCTKNYFTARSIGIDDELK